MVNECELRACKMAEFLNGIDGFWLNIGPGMSELEFLVGGRKITLDKNINFLKSVSRAGGSLIKAVAEALPFRDRVLPTVTTQSTFQVMSDQRAFIRELSRVLRGTFILTIEYGNCYDSEAQEFKASELDDLMEFMDKLDLKVREVRYLNYEGEWVENASKGFSLWIFGNKCFIPSRES